MTIGLYGLVGKAGSILVISKMKSFEMTRIYFFTGVVMVFAVAFIYTNNMQRRRTAPARLKPHGVHNEDINRGRLGDIKEYDRLRKTTQ